MLDHCPHCDMPLFARPYDAARAAATASALSERFIEPNVMVVDDAMARSEDLIACAEQIGAWRHSGVAEADAVASRASRTSAFQHVSEMHDAAFAQGEAALRQAAHAAAFKYAEAIGDFPIQHDLGFQLLRYQTGGVFTPHADRQLHTNKVYGSRLISIIIYLNDAFEGGELRFVRQGLVYNPSAGSAIVFPSCFSYTHESLAVLSGVKYCAVTWMI